MYKILANFLCLFLIFSMLTSFICAETMLASLPSRLIRLYRAGAPLFAAIPLNLRCHPSVIVCSYTLSVDRPRVRGSGYQPCLLKVKTESLRKIQRGNGGRDFGSR